MNEWQLKNAEPFLNKLHWSFIIDNWVNVDKLERWLRFRLLRWGGNCMFGFFPPFRPPVCYVGGTESVIADPEGTDFWAIDMRPGFSFPLWTLQALIHRLAKSIANDVQLKWAGRPKMNRKLCHHYQIFTLVLFQTAFYLSLRNKRKRDKLKGCIGHSF